MSYQVTATDVAARPTAVVSATTTWQGFSTLWKVLLDEVWATDHITTIPPRSGSRSTTC